MQNLAALCSRQKTRCRTPVHAVAAKKYLTKPCCMVQQLKNILQNLAAGSTIENTDAGLWHPIATFLILHTVRRAKIRRFAPELIGANVIL